MKTRIVSFALGSLVVLLLGACASVPMATPEEDARAKEMLPPPGKALIYLYRNESMGAGVSFDVTLDGKPVGSTAANTYFMWVVDPGKHTITSKGENLDEITLNCEADRRYFVWQEVKMGFLYARNKLQQVSLADGLKGVNECKLAKGNPTPSK